MRSLPSVLFPSDFPTKTTHISSPPCMLHALPTHPSFI
jgi:hypothetical protein